jgi:hypothetical protein
MNDDLDKLADQLRRFQPAEVSDELRQRVARDLADAAESNGVSRATRTSVRWRAPAWITAVTAAAVLLVIATTTGPRLWERFGNDMAHQPAQDPVAEARDLPPTPDVAPGPAEPEPPPSLLAYRLASAHSVDDVVTLLDRHARVLLTPSPDTDLAGFLGP